MTNKMDEIYGMLRQGIPTSEIIKICKCSYSTISKISREAEIRDIRITKDMRELIVHALQKYKKGCIGVNRTLIPDIEQIILIFE